MCDVRWEGGGGGIYQAGFPIASKHRSKSARLIYTSSTSPTAPRDVWMEVVMAVIWSVSGIIMPALVE